MREGLDQIVILAGGIGLRFWPLSTEKRPKQFLDILGLGRSLLRMTFDRFGKKYDIENIWIVTNEKYVPLVQEQIPEIPQENILAEPSKNNTAPCIAYAAFKIMDLKPEANLAIVPSDHWINEEDKFLNTIDQAFSFAKKNPAILTVGIRATSPHTGYGYIQISGKPENSNENIFKVQNFTEKPDHQTAVKYVNSGQLWNAGIFIFKGETILDEFKKYQPEIYNTLNRGRKYFNSPDETVFLRNNYSKTPNISIDYAIMERSKVVYTIPGDFEWSDLGSWSSVVELIKKSSSRNEIKNVSPLLNQDSAFHKGINRLLNLRGKDKFLIFDKRWKH